MPDPSTLRDSTQIVLPRDTLSEYEAQLDEEFTVTIFPAGEDHCRIIASPVEIKDVHEFLARNGVNVR